METKKTAAVSVVSVRWLQVHESDQLSLPVRQVDSLDMVPEHTPCFLGGVCTGIV